MVNVYKLKLRGKKERIYFLPEHQEDPVYGLTRDTSVTERLRRKVR
jgi:hypothetical protein